MKKPLKVFILAGQSNMEGQGFIAADPARNAGKGSLEHLAKDPATAPRYKHLVDTKGTWRTRDDVYIHYLERKGKLTIGYGADEQKIGPELGFGWIMGDHYREPVLLIKLAWGGKSLAADFRPPSAGGKVGPYYTELIRGTRKAIARIAKDFPELADTSPELCGFGWHQGWNDRVNQTFNDEYEKNLACLIRDLRRDLGAERLPFVIAETGMTGPTETHPRALSLMKAQAAVARYPEFQGNVAFVGTRDFWRAQEDSPSGQGYHWNTNAETYYLIGDAMGKAMRDLVRTPNATRTTFSIGKPGKSANDKLNIAFIGSGGWIAQQPYNQGCSEENLVAFCDVDHNQCAGNMKKWRTDQPFFEDFRKMLDKMHKQIDAVVVSTPDHTHFPATQMAMERGIHVYTQKPLAHNIWQVRTLAKSKEKYKLITQMGNQGHSDDGTRNSVELVRAGVIGDVTRVLCRNDGPSMGGEHFGNPATMPPPRSPIPAGLDWDLWLGPTAQRDFYRDYLPLKWRAFYDFGSGMLGDFGCHTFDTPVWALDLDPPTVVECLYRTASLDGLIPTSSHIRFHFPAKGKRGPVVLDWFDGAGDWSRAGSFETFGVDKDELNGNACLMLGTKGILGCGTHAGQPTLYPEPVQSAWQASPPPKTIARVQGGPFREWMRGIKGEGPEPASNFSVSANLTEIILLGVLAQRFNTRIEWDAKAGRIKNHPELNAFVKEPARAGWRFGENV